MKKRIHLLGIIASIALPINAYAICPSGTQRSGEMDTLAIYLKWSDESEWNLCLNLTRPEMNNARDGYGHGGFYEYQCGNIKTRQGDIRGSEFDIVDRNGNFVRFKSRTYNNDPRVEVSCKDQGAVVVCTRKATTTQAMDPLGVQIPKVLHQAYVSKMIRECRKVVF